MIAFLDVPYTYEDFKEHDLVIGSGSILVIDERTSVIEILTLYSRFLLT